RIGRALGLDARDPGVAQAAHDEPAHRQVLVQELGVVLVEGEPVRLPRPVDPEPEGVGVDLVSHQLSPSSGSVASVAVASGSGAGAGAGAAGASARRGAARRRAGLATCSGSGRSSTIAVMWHVRWK